jgi:hypothetical protein
VEYAINLALVAIAVIEAMRILGPRRGNTFSVISDSLPGGLQVGIRGQPMVKHIMSPGLHSIVLTPKSGKITSGNEAHRFGGLHLLS